MSAEILPFRPRPRPEPEPKAPPVVAAFFRCVREHGTWNAGVWVVAEAETCEHRHRTQEAAEDCLRDWSRVDSGLKWVGVVRKHHSGHGQVLAVDVEGRTCAVERRRPDRYHEEACTVGGVTVTMRRWFYPLDMPEPDRPIEIIVSCGDFERRWIAPKSYHTGGAREVAGVLSVLMVAPHVDAVVADWQAMHREPELPDGVVRIR